MFKKVLGLSLCFSSIVSMASEKQAYKAKVAQVIALGDLITQASHLGESKYGILGKPGKLEESEIAEYEQTTNSLSTEDFMARYIFVKASSFLEKNTVIKEQLNAKNKGIAGWKKLADQADQNLKMIEPLLPDIEYLRQSGFFN